MKSPHQRSENLAQQHTPITCSTSCIKYHGIFWNQLSDVSPTQIKGNSTLRKGVSTSLHRGKIFRPRFRRTTAESIFTKHAKGHSSQRLGLIEGNLLTTDYLASDFIHRTRRSRCCQGNNSSKIPFSLVAYHRSISPGVIIGRRVKSQPIFIRPNRDAS